MSAATLFSALADTTVALTERVLPAVVAIGSGGRGTGIVIGTNRVLTNAHHLRDNTTSVHFAQGTQSDDAAARSASVQGQAVQGRAVQGRVIGVDPSLDLAVLEVPTGSITPLVWAEVGPSLGALVFAATRAGTQPSLTHGFVSAIDRTFRSPMRQDIMGAFEHTAPLRKGSSGGPVLDADGRVVGLTVVRENDTFALALPSTAALRQRVTELTGSLAA
jgi:serine protease Do